MFFSRRPKVKTIRPARRPGYAPRLQVEQLESRTLLTTYTLPLTNLTGLDPTQQSIYVLGYSTSSTALLQPEVGNASNLVFGTFPSTSGTFTSFDLSGVSTITIDANQSLIGARVYFFVAPPGTPPTLSYSSGGANVTQPLNPPSNPYPFDIVEITAPGSNALPTIDVQTVDGFVSPLTLTLFDSGGAQIGQVGQSLPAAGQPAVVNRQDILTAYTTFMTDQGSVGTPYLNLLFKPNSIVGQAGGILNPGLYVSEIDTTNQLVNLDSSLNSVWDADLNTLFGLTTLSLRGVASAMGDTGTAIAADTYTATVVNQTYPGSTFSLPALRFQGTNVPGNVFDVYNPLGVAVSTNTAGSQLLGTITGTTLTLTSTPASTLVPGMYIQGAGVPPGTTIASVAGNVITLSADLGNPAPNSQYLFSKIPGLFQTPGRMVFANSGLFADNTVQFAAGSARATVLGNLENQIVSALNRGVALKAPTSGTAGYTSAYWGDQSKWYPANTTVNLFSLFMHTGTINGTPIFTRPANAVANARGTLMGQAYGFAFDENAGPVPPAPVGQPGVPSKFDPIPANTATIRITLGPWFSPSTNPNPGPAPGPDTDPTPSHPLGGPLFVGGARGTASVYRQNSATDSYSTEGTDVSPISDYTGSVRVASGDVNGDGINDSISGVAPGFGSRFVVRDGKTAAVIFDGSAFESTYTGGVYLAAGDFNGDGKDEVVVTGDNGAGARVIVFDGAALTGGQLVGVADFFGLADLAGAADTIFRGGTRPAVGDINGDGVVDLIVAAGFLGGPRVTIWDGNSVAAAAGGTPNANPIANFFVFEQSVRDGIFVAAGDLNSDGSADLIAGGGPNGGPRLRVVDGLSLLSTQNADESQLASFFAGDPNTRGGVRVASRFVDDDAIPDIVTGSGTNVQGEVRVYHSTSVLGGSDPSAASIFDPFGAVLADGVYVG